MIFSKKSTYDWLVVGLGNPGKEYEYTRHNVGFMALDYIALRENTTISNLRFKALTGECTLNGKKVLLMKPQTFMNLSGEAVREAAAFYKIPPQNILVIFDDINFAPGIFRIRGNGSAGGHNGIKSIISCLGTDAFPRVKLGVGTPPPQWELMNWVLGNPSPEDQKKIIASMEDVYQTAKLFVGGDLQKASQLYNGKKHE
jgi:PTH1 family peptidyl-tRNA hydrolase